MRAKPFFSVFSLWPLCFCGVVVLVLALPAAARLNLPQQAHETTLHEAARDILQRYLIQPAAAPALPGDLQELLVKSLPAEGRGACAEMIEHWGTVAEGTATWSVRALFRWEQAGQRTLLVAFRCGSSYADYASYYNERLGIVSLEPSSARLRLIPVAEDCDNCSDLYHLEFSGEFAVPPGTLAVLAMTFSSDNPCCDGPSQWRYEQLIYVLLPEGSVALALDRVHERYDHDDEAGDTEEVCRSGITPRRNPAGQLAGLVAEIRCEATAQPVTVQVRRFAWQPATRRFQEQGTQPRPR